MGFRHADPVEFLMFTSHAKAVNLPWVSPNPSGNAHARGAASATAAFRRTPACGFRRRSRTQMELEPRRAMAR
jgi:hypothetical protein